MDLDEPCEYCCAAEDDSCSCTQSDGDDDYDDDEFDDEFDSDEEECSCFSELRS